MLSKFKPSTWYKCIKDIPDLGFTAGFTYKCNIDGLLVNRLGINVILTEDFSQGYFQELTEDSQESEDFKETDTKNVSYYEKDRTITPFDVIIDWELDFFLGNVVKYIARLGRKPGVNLTREEKDIQDIDKMIAYLEKKKETIKKYV